MTPILTTLLIRLNKYLHRTRIPGITVVEFLKKIDESNLYGFIYGLPIRMVRDIVERANMDVPCRNTHNIL